MTVIRTAAAQHAAGCACAKAQRMPKLEGLESIGHTMQHADTRSFELRHLAPGNDLHLSLLEGSELFCRQGPLEISIPPQAWADGAPGLALRLQPGQGWRAGADLQIRVRSLSQAMASLELRQSPTAKSRISSEEGMRPRAWSVTGWLRGFRRGQHAA